MRVIFVDTNLFIQCSDLNHLPWRNIYTDDVLLIMVPRTVLDEIDRHKQDGNTRRARRARKTSSFFRKIILSEVQTTIIREDAPHIELSFATPHETQRPNNCDLDLSRPDDRIIDEALNYAVSNPAHVVELLTYDTTPILTARRCGLSVSIIPDDWLLPPEPDPRDKRIADLEQKVKEFEKMYPQIEIVAYDENDVPADRLLINVITYQVFSEYMLDELVSKAAGRNPLLTEFNEPILSKHSYNSAANLVLGIETRFHPPTEKEVSKYTNDEYPKWLEEVRTFFTKIPGNYDYQSRCITLSFAICNSGSVPAENIMVEFETVGGPLFLPPRSNEGGKQKTRIDFPTPPQPPRGKWIQKQRGFIDMANSFQANRPFSFSSIDNYIKPYLNIQSHILESYPNIQPHIPKQRDRNSFYWREGMPSSSTAKRTFECREFLHKVDPEMFSMELFISSKEKIENFAVKCLITASNLPEPIRKTLPIKVQYEAADIKRIAEDILTKSLPRISFGKHEDD